MMDHCSIPRGSGEGRRAGIIAFALLMLAVGCSGQTKPVERRGAPAVPVVSGEVSGDPQAVSDGIVRLFRDKRGLGRFEKFSAARAGDEYFPTDYQLRQYSDQPALQAYAAEPAAERPFDVYVYDFSDADDKDAYWTSEYFIEDAAVPFRCNFLIHLAPLGGSRTRLDVLEVTPRVWVGKKFAFEAHGPGMYLDIRPVQPTTADRTALVGVIQQGLRR